MKYLKITIVSFCLMCGLWSVARLNADSRFSPNAAKPANQIYAQSCARCHGADGRGKTELGETYDVPDLTESNHSDSRWANKIAKGGGAMPAFGKKLSKAEIKSVVAYIRTLKK